MTRNFEYSVQVTHEADITIEDIGNCIIEGNDTELRYYYLWICTSDIGITRIYKWGPVLIGDLRDTQDAIYSYNFSYLKKDYSETLVRKTIESFLNDPKINIFQARELTLDELKEKQAFVDTSIYTQLGEERWKTK